MQRLASAKVGTTSDVFITVQDTGGDFGRGQQPCMAGRIKWFGKTASLEWPEASVRAIDIERGERTPEAIALHWAMKFGGRFRA